MNFIDPYGFRHWGKTAAGYLAKGAGIAAIVIGSFEVAKGTILMIGEPGLGTLAGLVEVSGGLVLIGSGIYLYSIGDLILNEQEISENESACN